MGIKRLSKAQFGVFNPAQGPLAANMGTEKAWFADDGENVIGAIILDRADNDWTYVILGREQHGTFRWIEGESCLSTQEEAESRLKAAISRIEESGERVFPQD